MATRNFELQKLSHDTVRIYFEGTLIYIDPFQVTAPQADLIFITHDHYDHCSLEDITRISTPKTIIVAPTSCKERLAPLKKTVASIHYMKPGDQFSVRGIPVRTIPAYNTNKFRGPGQLFHPKSENGLGYILQLGSRTLLHAGDTDATPELLKEKVDIALLPVSGTYVMTPEEAASAANEMKPKLAIPMHYGAIVGTKEDAEKFRKLAQVTVQIMD